MTNTAAKECGFSLVEVTLALGVVAVCVVTIFGLLPVGLETDRNATQQVSSSDILAAVIADLRATPVTTPRGSATTSHQFMVTIPANPVAAATTATLFFDGTGAYTAASTNNSRFRLTITFQPNSGGRSATLVDLKMTWPPDASAANAAGSAEMFVALDRN